MPSKGDQNLLHGLDSTSHYKKTLLNSIEKYPVLDEPKRGDYNVTTYYAVKLMASPGIFFAPSRSSGQALPKS